MHNAFFDNKNYRCNDFLQKQRSKSILSNHDFGVMLIICLLSNDNDQLKPALSSAIQNGMAYGGFQSVKAYL